MSGEKVWIYNFYYRELKGISFLDFEEEQDLFEKIKRGKPKKIVKEAKDKIIKANQRLVIEFAKKYAIWARKVSFMDLVQEGNIGLIEAVKKFEPGRGYRFSTYAMWWVRQYISRALMNQNRTVRIPVSTIEDISRLVHLQDKLKRKLFPKEIKKAKISEISLKAMKNITISLDEEIYPDEKTENLYNFIPDDQFNVRNIVDNHLLKDEIKKILLTLTSRERKIIKLHFGFTKKGKRTFREIGEIMGLSYERVRQVQQKSFEKIRKKKILKEIKGLAKY